jgi:uncharacterized protein (DUF4415 family)
MPRKLKQPIFDADNPEWTEEDFAKGTRFPPGTLLIEATQQMLKKRGRPKLDKPKKVINLRVDEDVLDAYRKLGTGWQTKMNADLRKARKLKQA